MQINNSIFNFEYIHLNYDWYSIIEINGYPVLNLIWNVLLLAVPYFITVYLIKYWRTNRYKKIEQKILVGFLGFVWLMFIPNTAYLIADVRHIANQCIVDSYYRLCVNNSWHIIFFFTYAVLGWVSMVLLLNQMKELIKKIFNKKAGDIFILYLIPLISLGVLLGLLNRWNSWEIFIYPVDFFKHVLLYFTNYIYFYNWFLFTIFLYILYYGGNYLFKEKIKL